MPYGPGHQMSQSVNKNLSYRKRGRRLFDKPVDTSISSKKIEIETKMTPEELAEFTLRFKEKQKKWNQKALLVSVILTSLIVGILVIIFN